jgi:excisionase family DNA binding protein
VTSRFLTVADVAEELAVSIRTVQRYVADGALRAVRLPGGQIRVRRSALDAALLGWQTMPDGRRVGGMADEQQAA